MKGSSEIIKDYKKKYPDGKYLNYISFLDENIINEINRPKKSLWISVIGSIFIPGFGHFYAGDISTGIFSFLTNAALVAGAVNAFYAGNYFQMIIFSAVEMQFYSYSIFAGINNVGIYNNMEKFHDIVMGGISAKF